MAETDFWEMTLAELERFFKSYHRQEKARLKEKAVMDYLLADLIGYSVARTHSSANKMPELHKHYSFIFEDSEREEIEDKKAEKQAELSALRFKLFAQAYNEKFNKEAAKD